MCGRYTLSVEPEWSELRIRVPDELLTRPRFNAGPGRPQLVVMRAPDGQLELAERPWGAHAGPRVVANARMESLGWPTWREHVARCVVPADGFVEWRKTKQGKEPLWFRRADRPGALLWFAGIMLPDGFVIVTTPPSADVQAVHDRMPAILPPGRVGAWLDDEWASAQRLLATAPAGLLSATAVSTRINSVANDDAACLEPAATAQDQLRLF